MTTETEIIEAPTHRVELQRTATNAITETSPDALIRYALDKGADLDKLQQLYDLQREWKKDQARNAFHEAMTAFKAEPIEIMKRKAVDFGDTHYKHAELSDVTAAVCPMLARHDLSHRWDCEQRDGKIIVSCVVTHKLGHSERLTMEAPADTSGKKNSIQSIGSTKTYLERYTLLGLLGLSTKGEDDDGRSAANAAAVEMVGEQILDGLIEQLKVAKNDAEALSVWRIGLPSLKMTKNIKAVDEFRARVEAHRLALREAGQ